LERPGFRNIPLTRWAYFRQFFDIISTFKARLGRIVFSALGVPVDYSGTGWSLTDWTHEEPTMRHLQRWALAQLSCYAIIVTMFSNNLQAILFWWIVPVLIGYPAVNFFRNLEHADCELSTDVPNCLHNTRSVRSNLIVRTLLWDTNFHAEHHTYPMVPFYNLHKLNALLSEHVIHNEIDHFTTQNWAAVMPGGWIDQQTKRFREDSESAETQLIEKKNE
jgi:fatty acid desaturase